MAKTYSIKAVVEVVEKATAPLKKIGSGFIALNAKVNTLAVSVDKLGTKLSSIGGRAEGLGRDLSTRLTLPILGFGAAALKVAGDYEMLQAEFETMLGGNVKAAEKFTEKIKEFGAVTPFEVMDLAKNAKLMMNFGISSKKVLPYLQMLGDVAGGNANKLGSLTLAFSQVQSAGKLMGQDLLQMINAGFNPLQIISKKTGESMNSLKDKMSKGAISAQMVADAFKTATSKGGLFYKNMQRQSKTIPGLISTMKDAFTEFLAMFGILIKDALQLNKVIPKLTDKSKSLIEKIKIWTKENPKLFKFILIVAGIVAALGPLLLIVGGITTIFGKFFMVMAVGIKTIVFLVKGIGVLITVIKILSFLFINNPILLAIMAIATAAFLIIKYWKPIKEFFKNLWDGIVKYAKIIGKKLHKIFVDPFINAYKSIKKVFGGLFDKLFGGDDININVNDKRKRVRESEESYSPAVKKVVGMPALKNEMEVKVNVSADPGSSAVIDRVHRKGKGKVKINNTSSFGASYITEGIY